MAEFLIRVQDKLNLDSPFSDVKCLKRGDVVCVCPDGWRWSDRERTLPFWRIVKVPDMMISEAEAFLTPEPGDPVTNKMLQRRAFRFDLSLLDPAFVADDSRKAPFVVTDALNARDAKVLKPAISDPAVIGGDSRMIG